MIFYKVEIQFDFRENLFSRKWKIKNDPTSIQKLSKIL
jgi:hypothetical protein